MNKYTFIVILSLLVDSKVLQFMTGEVVLVCTPVSYLVGKISPDDAILIEWQLQERDVIVEMLDGLVGDDGAENQE